MGTLKVLGRILLLSQIIFGVVYASRGAGSTHRLARRSINQHDSTDPTADSLTNNAKRKHFTDEEESPGWHFPKFNFGLLSDLMGSNEDIEVNRNQEPQPENLNVDIINNSRYSQTEVQDTITPSTQIVPNTQPYSNNDQPEIKDSSSNSKENPDLPGKTTPQNDQDNIDTSGINFYTQHTTNLQCVKEFCHNECENVIIFRTNSKCFNCINKNSCSKISNSDEVKEYKSCGRERCREECTTSSSEDTPQSNSNNSNPWYTNKCSQCMAKNCISQPAPHHIIKDANTQCINKCQNSKSCQNQDPKKEETFRTCSSECHINYDNIREARECINNRCDQHINEECRTCLDVCVIETLVLGYYKEVEQKQEEQEKQEEHINSDRSFDEEQLLTQGRRANFVNNILPKYQETVLDQEIARSNHEQIDYTGVDKLDEDINNVNSPSSDVIDSQGINSQENQEQNQRNHQSGDSNANQETLPSENTNNSNIEFESNQDSLDSKEHSNVVFMARSKPSLIQNSNSNNVKINKPKKQKSINNIVELVRNSLKPKQRLKMYASARQAIKQSILKEKRKRRDLMAQSQRA